MFAKAYRTALLAVALLLPTGISYGQMGKLGGKVIGPDGQPLQGAVVRADRQEMRGKQEVKTNKRGEYLFGFLPMGVYNITLEVGGRQMSNVSNVRPSSAGEPTELDFDLAKLASERAAANKGQMTEEALRGMTPEQRKAYEASLKKRRQQISRNKDLNDAFNAGMDAMDARNYKLAIASFETAGALDAKQVAPWAQLGRAQSAYAGTLRGDDAKAARDSSIGAYLKALEIQPDNAGFRNNLALEMIKNGNEEEGFVELEKAATLDPGNAGKYYFNLGAVMINSQNTEGAVDAFRKAVEIDPTYSPAHYQLGVSMMAQAKMGADGSIQPVPGTIEAFEACVSSNPSGPYAAQAQAMIQSLKGSVSTSYQNPDAKKRKRRKKQ
jgi:tetratricopeptide (TPR) repeat protein